jgi:hypothetical protein
MAYKGKNPKLQNGNGSGGAGANITCTNCNRVGHLAQNCRSKPSNGNHNGGMKQCDNCGHNKSHTTADCYKNKSKKPAGDSAKPPSRPCSHCQGQHYDNQCPNMHGNIIQGQNQTQNAGKTPSRPCKHCGMSGHFDNACPTQNNGSQSQSQSQSQSRPTPNWQSQNQIINQNCPTCGGAHQASQCPNKSTTPAPQYISSSTEVYAQLVKALRDNPGNAVSIFGQWDAIYLHFSPQAPQQQAPVFGQQEVPPMARWANNGENTQYADFYEETSSFSQLSVQGQSQEGQGYGEVDRDGDVVMW